MKWKNRRQSTRIDDRRSRKSPTQKKAGISGIGLLLMIGVMYFMGADPRQLLQMLLTQQQSALSPNSTPSTLPPELENQLAQFTSVVLADTEDVWNTLLPNYKEPTLVLFSGAVQSACGHAQAAMGPFYCGADQQVYIDLSFYEALRTRHNAPGDFAQAYVIAHEIGHHIQHLQGTSQKVHAAKPRISQEKYNRLSVRLELQADFLAGVWAHHAQRTQNILDPGDLEEALIAATAIGDDTLQKQTRGQIVPDSFTHGTSAQRVRWFKKGFQTGDLSQGNTFDIPYDTL